MFDWVISNIGTLAVLAVVVAVLVVAFIVLRRDKKKGISSCGGVCANCAMNCHSKDGKTE